MELEKIVIRINEISEQSCEGQIELGGLLIEAKDKVKHGQWKKWLEDNTNFSQSKANKLMKACKLVEVAKSYTFTNLDICKIFALTNLKEEIDVEVFTQNFDLANMSVREIEKEVKLYNKQLKQDEQETKKSQKEIVGVESREEKSHRYTKIETEIKVDNVSYYTLDEVCGVMGKTRKEFEDKYGNLVVQIKGYDCIKVIDFLKIFAKEDSKNDTLDFDKCNVTVTVYKTEVSFILGSFLVYYNIKSCKDFKYHLLQLNTSNIYVNGKFEIDKIRENVAKVLDEFKVYDKNTINCVVSIILTHLESIKDEIIKGNQAFENWSNNFDNAFKLNNSQPTTLDKDEYRKLVKVCHPDNGGSDELMNIISKLYKK